MKRNNNLMEAVERIVNNNEEDWLILQEFVLELQAEYAENALFEEDDKQRFSNRHYIRGMLDLILLPHMRKELIKEAEEREMKKRTEQKDAERRKFNPGAWLKDALH